MLKIFNKWISMKFSGKIEDGTSNEPLYYGSNPWPWQRFVLSECSPQVHSPSEGLRSSSAFSSSSFSIFRKCHIPLSLQFLELSKKSIFVCCL